MKETTHKKTKVPSDEYGEWDYRGYRLYRNDSVSNGYWGRWDADDILYGSSLRDIIEKIDWRITKREKE